jgi:S-adenosylmethionine-diacylglycerol 3-amino-3-carboxypropyl transferase
MCAGRFEAYLETFRTQLLPRIHSSKTIGSVFTQKSRHERAQFYDEVWNTGGWRVAFAFFFSRRVMQHLGRDPRFFRYAQTGLVSHLQSRVRHAFVDLDPSVNPYLHWMLKGEYGSVLPFALRSENIPAIRANLDKLSWQTSSLENYLANPESAVDRFALSDVFEYVDDAAYTTMLERIIARSSPRARLTYWNMLVPRTRPPRLAASLAPDTGRASELHDADKTFFYSRLVIENVC